MGKRYRDKDKVEYKKSVPFIPWYQRERVDINIIFSEKKESVEVYCLECGKYLGMSGGLFQKKYCSDECAREFKNRRRREARAKKVYEEHGFIKGTIVCCCFCHKYFVSDIHNKTACSFECRKQHGLILAQEYRDADRAKCKKFPRKASCVICGKEYQQRFEKHVNCSRECYEINRRSLDLECIWCGKEFKGREENLYCSKACVDAARHEDNSFKERRTCVTCGNKFTVIDHQTTKYKYCSDECRNFNKQKKEPKPKPVKKPINCQQCGIEVENKITNTKYCERCSKIKEIVCVKCGELFEVNRKHACRYKDGVCKKCKNMEVNKCID